MYPRSQRGCISPAQLASVVLGLQSCCVLVLTPGRALTQSLLPFVARSGLGLGVVPVQFGWYACIVAELGYVPSVGGRRLPKLAHSVATRRPSKRAIGRHPQRSSAWRGRISAESWHRRHAKTASIRFRRPEKCFGVALAKGVVDKVHRYLPISNDVPIAGKSVRLKKGCFAPDVRNASMPLKEISSTRASAPWYSPSAENWSTRDTRCGLGLGEALPCVARLLGRR